MCHTTWENLSSTSLCPPIHPVNVCQSAVVLPARGSEATLSSSSPVLSMPHSSGFLWLLTKVIASHSSGHVFPSDSLSTIGKCSISLLAAPPLCLNWSSKLRPGMCQQACSIGCTPREAFLVPLSSA